MEGGREGGSGWRGRGRVGRVSESEVTEERDVFMYM